MSAVRFFGRDMVSDFLSAVLPVRWYARISSVASCNEGARPMTPDASGRYRVDRLDHDAAAHGHGRGASRVCFLLALLQSCSGPAFQSTSGAKASQFPRHAVSLQIVTRVPPV